MRIYSNAYELMSETGRNLYEMGITVKPRFYQNQCIEDNPQFETKELEAEQYTLLDLPDPHLLMTYTSSGEWVEKEFEERVSGFRRNPGEAWKLRKEVWEEFLNRKGRFDYSYPERINRLITYRGTLLSQLNGVIQLLKDDPDTRKAILSIYDTAIDSNFYDGSRRIPCSMYYNFMIREVPGTNNKVQLNLHYHQRSADFITHFGNDVYLAWKLLEYVSDHLKVQRGYLVHCIDSLHVYKKDWETLKTSFAHFIQ